MSQIKIENLTFCYENSYDNIFEHVNLLLDTDWKLGFIGRNGRGKTTFFNLLLGKYPYSGSITHTVEFEYFPYAPPKDDLLTLDFCKDIIAPFCLWEAQMETLLTDGSEAALLRYGDIQEQYAGHNGYIIEELIEKELNLLKTSAEILSRPLSTLSYGERTKVMLAGLFLKKNRFLLIDEPTSHLDAEGQQSIGAYLNAKKGYILVSHDRALLDQATDHILSINRSNIEIIKGNYSVWQQNKERTDQYELDQNHKLKQDILRLTAASRRTAGWSADIEKSKIGSHSADRGFIGHQSAKMMKRAKSIQARREQAVTEKSGLLKNLETTEPLKLHLLPAPQKKLAELIDLSISYDGRQVFQPVSFALNQSDRIALCGKNGCGKSSILKLLTGGKPAYSGSFRIAGNLEISYVPQDTSWLKGSLSEFARDRRLDDTLLRSILRKLDFSRAQFEKDLSTLSEGQKKKVTLAASLCRPAHLFLWDEPLNYIDIPSRLQIEELLLTYGPTMIFVEHDSVFTQKIANKMVRLSCCAGATQ